MQVSGAGAHGLNHEPDSTPATAPDAASLSASLRLVWRDMLGLVSDRVDLLSLELHSAGRALAQMLLWVVAASILGVTAWFALCGAAVMFLLERGLHWSAVLLLVMGVNFLAAWLALARAKTLGPRLALPATRRHLSLNDADYSAEDTGDEALDRPLPL